MIGRHLGFRRRGSFLFFLRDITYYSPFKCLFRHRNSIDILRFCSSSIIEMVQQSFIHWKVVLKCGGKQHAGEPIFPPLAAQRQSCYGPLTIFTGKRLAQCLKSFYVDSDKVSLHHEARQNFQDIFNYTSHVRI